MIARTVRVLGVLLLVLNGLFFVSNIYVLGDAAAAVAMHGDLAPTVSPVVANVKVIVTFTTGALYLLAAAGILRHRRALAACGVAAFVLFDGLYLYELTAWGRSHPRVWIDFTVFGGLSLLFGAMSWREWRRPPDHASAAPTRTRLA